MALDPEFAALARAYEPDRYLAALATPEDARADLIALAAFAAEVKRVPRLVHDPLVGEIRLTWWREALERIAEGEPAGHPIADALAQPIRHGLFSAARLTGFIDAMAFDLSPVPFADDQAREVYLGKTEGTLMRLALARLGEGEGYDRLIQTAATAYGLARASLALAAPAPLVTEADLSASKLTIQQLAAAGSGTARREIAQRLAATARARGDEARQLAIDLRAPQRLALLPLAMIGPYTRWALRSSGAPATAPLTRVWRIWRAARSGRLGD